MKLKKNIFRNYINMFGLKTKQKIIVIESDDWGSIRIPNKNVYNTLLNKGISMDKCPYSKYDCLEEDDDLIALYSLLDKLNSKFNKKPVITTNFLTANPDFEKIKKNQFSFYEYESIEKSYENSTKSRNIKKYIHEGISNKYIKPQFHGREHLNVKMWMKLLNENKIIREAFEYSFFALSFNNSSSINLPFLASFMKFEKDDVFDEVILSGLEEFTHFFGYKSNSFIAPVYIWDENIEKCLSLNEVKSIQGLYFKKKTSTYLDNKSKLIKRNIKMKNDFHQLNLVRNCFFEPSTSDKLDWVNECLKDIEVAFMWNRPAIICSHRLNFVGGLSEENRNKNLKSFEELIIKIVTKWPDAIFVSSDEVFNYL